MVGLQVKSLGGDFSQFETQLTDVGMQVTTASSYYGVVEGFAPVNALPTIAEMPQTMSGQVLYKPIYRGEYQGEAYNEAETSMYADAARTEFNVDGTGVTIGVLSDSVNQYNGGLSASYETGDLNPNNPVDVVADGAAGGTDEGRAMLENIHDVAPGASLDFATARAATWRSPTTSWLLQKAGANIRPTTSAILTSQCSRMASISQAINTVVADWCDLFQRRR